MAVNGNTIADSTVHVDKSVQLLCSSTKHIDPVN